MKLTLVLILFLAGAASGAIKKRLVGSKSCKTDRQYHVQIESVPDKRLCGGSLLNTRWVITASHCAEQIVNLKLGANNNVSLLKKFWSLIKGSSKKLEQTIKVEQQFTYKDEEDRKHDIMLIKLNEDVSAKLPVIKLPPSACNTPEEGQQVEVGGWGSKTTDVKNAKTPKSLKCANTEIASCGENDKPGDKYFSDGDTTLCAFKAGVEVCYGDGGTAVEYNNALHGVVVSNPFDKCANNIVIANICHYRKWIDETMRNN